jgi:subtilisin family serine protease
VVPPLTGHPLFPAAAPHPDFQANIWSGQNIYVPGDIRNFYDNNNDVTDNWNPYYHGTLVASIIGSRGNNALGMSGVAWDVSLLILKVIGPTGHFAGNPAQEQEAFSSSVSGAISYAGERRAAAINCSFGGNVTDETGAQIYDPAVVKAIASAQSNGGGGMLIVAGAGNAGRTNDWNGYADTPASVPFDNVISVGATTNTDQRASYSNHGIYRVDLGAPGGEDGGVLVLGLKPSWNGNSYDPANYNFSFGTSFSTPHVSGAVALVKSKYPWETGPGVRDRILMGVDHASQFATWFRTKGRLNLNRALHPRTLIRNLSTRAYVGTDDNVLIGGFVIAGNTDDASVGPPAPLRVCIRGLGPSVGVYPGLENPTIELFSSSGKSLGANDDWQIDNDAGQIISYGMQPGDEREAALIRDLVPGAYTVVVSAASGSQNGIGLVELYELSGGTSERSRLVNISTRCYVGTGNFAAIAGTIIGGTPDDPALPDRRLLMLGRGPSLPDSIANRLQDPAVELRNSGGTLLDSNDTWTDIDGPYEMFSFDPTRIWKGNALEEELVAGGFFPCPNGGGLTQPCGYSTGTQHESALWPTLRSGAYTTILTGTGGATGTGLIEFYEK